MIVSDLNEGENSFHRLAENLPGIVYRVLIEDDNRTIIFNDMVETMTGYSSEELKKGKVCSIDPIILPEDKLHVINTVKNAIENNVPFEVEYRINTKSGEVKWFSERGRPIKGANGNPSYIDGVIFDITERKKVEKKLLLNRDNLINILNSMVDGVYIVDSNYDIEYVNPILTKEFGRYEGKKCYNYFHDRDEVCPWCKNQKVHEGKTVRWEWYSFKNQKTYDLIDTPLKNADGSISKLEIFRDITASKKIDQKLKESEEKYRLITENVDGLISIVDQNMNYEFVNEKAYFNILGRSKEEMIGKSPLSWVHPEDAEKIVEAFKIGFEKGKGSVEARIKDKKGIYHWFDIKGKTFIDHDGKKKALMISRDTTQHKQAEQIIVQEREKANLYLNVVEIILVALDRDGAITLINKKGHELLGYDEGELIGKNWFEVCLPPNNSENVYEYFKKLMAGHMELIKFYENPVWSKTGEERLISWSSVLYKDENGNVTGLLASGVDITERKKAELKLKESEENLKKQNVFLNTILESLTHPFYVINVKDYRVILTNSIASSEGLEQGKYCYSLTHSTDKPCEAHCICPLKEVKETKRACVVEHIHYDKEGNEKIYEIYGYPILDESGNVVQMIEYALNISDRKKAEQELIESEEKFRTIAEQSFMGIVIIQDGLFKYINQRARDINGYSVEDIQNWKPYEFAKLFHPEDRDFVMEQARKKQDGQIDVVIRHTYRVIKKSGEIAWLDNYSKTINYKGRSADLVITEDITDKIIAEQELKESEEKFRTIAERALMGIIIVQDNQVKYANEALLNLFEFSQEEILNWTKDDLTKRIHPEDLPFLREYREHLRRGETGLKPYYSYRVFTKLGKVKWIDQFSKKIQYKGRSAELVTIIDVTEKKEVEQELITLNTMKSELLRRMSHELKTPLVSIKGFSDLLLELHRDKLDEYVVRTIEQIRSGCYRLESLVSDILKTSELESGTVKLKKSKEDLSLLIKTCVSDSEGLIKLRNHTLNLEISDDLICSFEKKQIYNVITNILSNAIKYTPLSGKIEVKSEITNGFIIISIKDNGIGFSKEEKVQIFKKFGKIERYGQGYDIISEGSGLGLYISKKIVELHGGKIRVESEGRNKGSTFIVSLPIDEK